jgi:hypothetical protein
VLLFATVMRKTRKGKVGLQHSTIDTILYGLQQSRRLLKFCNTKLVLSFELYNSSKTGGITIVISNHNRRIKRLEIEDDKRAVVKI